MAFRCGSNKQFVIVFQVYLLHVPELAMLKPSVTDSWGVLYRENPYSKIILWSGGSWKVLGLAQRNQEMEHRDVGLTFHVIGFANPVPKIRCEERTQHMPS